MDRREIVILISIFSDIHDFCKEFEPKWHALLIEDQQKKIGKAQKRNRSPNLSLCEAMTIVVMFHQMRYRTFKDYYTQFVMRELKKYFPNLCSYSRFVHLMKTCIFPLFVFSQGCLGACTGISFIDSTILTVCHSRRIHSHRVFKKLAKRGKTSTGWFYGFKLHLIINDRGDIIAYMLTAGNVDDRKPVPDLAKDLFGKLFGDKGYISQELFFRLYEEGVQIITKLKRNMKNRLVSLFDKILLKKRGVIECVNQKLKFCGQIEHHRHRNPLNFLVNLVAGVVSYAYEPNKPSIQLTKKEKQLMLEYKCA